jgi:aspartate 1-decarboxylase
MICLNGPAARKVAINDIIIIKSYRTVLPHRLPR